MSRRIEARPYKLGSPENHEPEKIQELEERRAKHARQTGKKPVRTFGEVLTDRMKKLSGEDEEPEEEGQEQEEQREALLALHPGQDMSLANKKKVIIKG